VEIVSHVLEFGETFNNNIYEVNKKASGKFEIYIAISPQITKIIYEFIERPDIV